MPLTRVALLSRKYLHVAGKNPLLPPFHKGYEFHEVASRKTHLKNYLISSTCYPWLPWFVSLAYLCIETLPVSLFTGCLFCVLWILATQFFWVIFVFLLTSVLFLNFYLSTRLKIWLLTLTSCLGFLPSLRVCVCPPKPYGLPHLKHDMSSFV